MKEAILFCALLLSACGEIESEAHAEGTSDAKPPTAPGPSKWRFELKDTWVSHVVLANDGDVVAGGPMTGSRTFGSQTLRSDDSGVWVARFTSKGAFKWATLVDPPAKKTVEQYLSALSVGSDGTVRVSVDQREAPYLRRVTITADGAKQVVDPLIPATRTMDSSMFANGDALVSAEPGPKDKCKGAMIQRVAPGGKRVWSACNDKVDGSGLHRTSVVADGRNAMCANEWVTAYSTKGKRSWEAKHPDERWCQSLAMFDNGDVIAVFEEGATHTAMSWNANGKLGWTKKCTDLIKGPGSCLLDGLAVRGSDVLLTVRNGNTSFIAVLDGKTGDVKKTYPLGIDASLRLITATDSTIVFGTGGPSGMTIQSLDR